MSSSSAQAATDPNGSATRTADSAATRSDAPSAPFARQRLRLGIAGVGLSVVLSFGWLLLTVTGLVALPEGWHPLPQSIVGELPLPASSVIGATLAAMIVFVLHTLLLAPLEFVGGALVVRNRPGVARWAAGWLRGVTVQGVLFAVVAGAIATTANVIGNFGLGGLSPALVAAGFAIALLAGQGPLARIVASLAVREPSTHVHELATAGGVRPERIRVVDAHDESFVGGWIGLVNPQLWLPARWTTPEHASLLNVQLARRHAQWSSGARRRGLLRAVLWNATGVLLFAPMLPWSFTDPRAYLVLPALATLWSFLAVLLLPGPSRTTVYNADRTAATRLGTDAVANAITQLDRWQDDEPERSAGVEFVFHPVPSRNNRLRSLRAKGTHVLGGGHQLTRLTLFISPASLSLLSRVVHCNIGRPSLWVVYPGD